MRRRAALLLIVALTAGLAAGCGGEEEATPTPETTPGTTTTETTTTSETTTTETEPAEGDATAGKQVFLGASGCGTCHTLADAGTSGTVGPVLDDTKPSYDRVVDRVTNGFGAMPSFSSTLSETQIKDVAAYVSSVAGK